MQKISGRKPVRRSPRSGLPLKGLVSLCANINAVNPSGETNSLGTVTELP